MLRQYVNTHARTHIDTNAHTHTHSDTQRPMTIGCVCVCVYSFVRSRDINDQQIVRVSPCVHAIEYVCCLYYNIFRSRTIYARRRTRTAHCATPRSARHHDAPRRDQQAARAHAHALAPGGFSSVAPVARRSVVNSICYGLRVRVCDSVLAVRSAIHISDAAVVVVVVAPPPQFLSSSSPSPSLFVICALE